MPLQYTTPQYPMRSWIGVLGLFLLQQLVHFFVVILRLRKRLSLPLQSQSSSKVTQTSCIAVVLAEPVNICKEAKSLALVLDWCRRLQAQQVILYSPTGQGALLEGFKELPQHHKRHMTVEVIDYSQALADIVTAAQQVQEPVQQGDQPATAAWLQSKLQHKCQSAALQVPDLMLMKGSVHFA